MNRFRRGCLAPLFGLLLVPAISNGAAAPAPAEASRYAYLLGSEPGAVDPLAKVLKERYGYRVIDTSGASTLEEIEASVLAHKERVGPADDLLVFIGLPILRRPELYFVPEASNPEEPWTLLSAETAARRLSALDFGRGLWIYPSCGRGRDLDTLWSSRTPSTIDLLLVCDVESGLERTLTTQVFEKRGSETRKPEPVAWRSAEVFTILADLLLDPSAGEVAVTSEDLAYGIISARRGFEANAVKPYRVDGFFELLAVGSKDQFLPQFKEARNLEEALAVLDRFGASARSDEAVAQGYLSFLVKLAAGGSELTDVQMWPKDWTRLRTSAVERLGAWGTAASLDALGRVARDGADDVRWRAVSLLLRGDLRPEDLAVLREAAEDSSSRVRIAALSGLSLAQDRESLPVFRTRAVDDPDVEARLAAIQALATLGDESDEELYIGLLNDEEPRVRREAANGLARRGSSEDATRALLKRLSVESAWDVQQALVTALGRTSTDDLRDRVSDALIGAVSRSLEAGLEQPAGAAVGALGRIGGSGARDLLETLAEEAPMVSVQVAAVQGLGRLDPESSVELFEWAARSEHDALRLAAVSALGEADSDRSVEVLADRLDDANPYVKAEAERSLVKLDPYGERRLRIGGEGNKTWGLRDPKLIVRELEDPADRSRFWIEQLESDDPRTREAAVEALARAEGESTLEQLVAALRSRNVLTRQSAAEALGGRPEAEEEIVVGALVKAAGDVNSAVRQAAVRALGKRSSPRALQQVFSSATDADADVRRAVARALGTSDSEQAQKVLERMAKDDESSRVREAAVQELQLGHDRDVQRNFRY